MTTTLTIEQHLRAALASLRDARVLLSHLSMAVPPNTYASRATAMLAAHLCDAQEQIMNAQRAQTRYRKP